MKKTFTPALPLIASLALALTDGPALAITVDVAQDAYSTATKMITPATGKATSLLVTSKETAFIRFDFSDTSVVPAAITPGNIQSATLRLYVTGIKAGDLSVHAVTDDWTEAVLKSTTLPAINATPITTIPAAEISGKHFVTVDVTAAVKAALGPQGNDFGFAIKTASPTARVYIGSKEGPGLGVAAQVDIDTSPLDSGSSSNVTILGTLNVSTSFTVEARPNSTGGLNNFIGMNAGAANTTGLGNTFVGHNCGKSNIGGSSNSFYGLNAGTSNTSGQDDCFFGQGSGAFNDNGSDNNFYGQAAGFNSFSGSDNNFFGWHAGFGTATGSNNAFFGDQAGAANDASNNAFFGSGAGTANSSGTQDCYFGINAGNKTTSSFNSFFGAGAGQFTTTGVGNSFFGNIAGTGVTKGSNNTFLGGNTGDNMTTESHNTLVGDTADGAAGVANATAIGANALVTASNSLVLGSINGVNGAVADTNVGIRVSAPNSALQVNGSLSLPVRTANNSILTSLADSDYVLMITGNTATQVVLPNPGITGRVYVIRNRASIAVTLGFIGAGPQIEGGATYNIPAGSIVQVICDGANWFRIN